MFNQDVYSVLFISLGLISTLSINSLRMNNTLNDISFRQHVEVTMVMGKVFQSTKQVPCLIYESARESGHIRAAAFIR